jgi:BirA family transcriptional regulator, biotin operon repressor / biotin---[acetyl-CoA-carboxylase] ligase
MQGGKRVATAVRTLAFQVLSRLSHEHFTSGAALARELQVSRSAISDALKEAQQHQVEIFSLTRRGYRLAAPLELLDVDIVRAGLGEVAHRVDVDVVSEIDSTNTAMLARAQNGAPSGCCLAAEIQTAGRGRRGRKWQSAFGASITFSLLWRFDRGAAQLGGLSLVVGLALVRALREAGVTRAMLKWPNDVLVDDEKLAGILIETSGDMLGPTAAVIGIGINVRLPAAAKESIDQPATDIAQQVDDDVSRNQLLAALLRELVATLTAFNRDGFAAFREAWIACHALHRREVTVSQADGNFVAEVTDIALDGSLIVEPLPAYRARMGRRVLLSSAEISVRATKPAPRVKVA